MDSIEKVPELLEHRANALVIQSTDYALKAWESRLTGDEDMADYYRSESDSLGDWAEAIFEEIGCTDDKGCAVCGGNGVRCCEFGRNW